MRKGDSNFTKNCETLKNRPACITYFVKSEVSFVVVFLLTLLLLLLLKMFTVYIHT